MIKRHRLSPIIHKKDRAGASWYFVRCTCGYRSLHSDLKMAGAAEQKHMDEGVRQVTDPLPIEEPCGCQVGQGHVCPPPWVDAEEWAAVLEREAR